MIILPSRPGPREIEWMFEDAGGDLVPMGPGGVTQRLNRIGSKNAVKVPLPPMDAALARIWFSRLKRAKQDGDALFTLRQKGLAVGAPGAPLVDGAVSGGTALAVRAVTPNYAFREGQWISLIAADGRYYCHTVSEQVLADAAGDAALTLDEPIRAEFADGDSVEVAHPKIMGGLENEIGMTIDANRHGLTSFVLRERR